MPTGRTCVPEREQCFATPCPQHALVEAAREPDASGDGGRVGRDGTEAAFFVPAAER